MAVQEIRVPDIGDFEDVPVIEILVKPGDSVKAEDSLVTLESDKATMDVPSPAAGTVKALSVKVGDKVKQGTLILTLDAASSNGQSTATPPPQPSPASGGGSKTETAPLSAPRNEKGEGDAPGEG